MKKAVISTGGKKYLLFQRHRLNFGLLKTSDKTASFEPLLVIDGDAVQVGVPTVDKASVVAEIVQADVQQDKVTSVRFKAKKRVHKVRGHRQHNTVLKITKIS